MLVKLRPLTSQFSAEKQVASNQEEDVQRLSENMQQEHNSEKELALVVSPFVRK